MDADGLYARAHKAIEELLPTLKGETVTREQWWKLLNININNKNHIAYKDAVNTVLWNLSKLNKKRKIEKNGRGFKVVDDTLEPINFKGANINSRFDLILPLGIHQYCFLYRKNIMILYGSKDSAKSGLLFNIIRLNMDRHRIVYFSSEMVGEELGGRLSKYNGLELGDWNFEANERSYDFHEVVEPDALNIIDFLELGGDDTEYYKAVALIRKIYDKLENGIAIIALQKNKDAEYPKGGSGALEKSRIALSLDPGQVTLTVAKNWCDGITTSPKGKSWTYNLVGGINIVNPQESYGE